MRRVNSTRNSDYLPQPIYYVKGLSGNRLTVPLRCNGKQGQRAGLTVPSSNQEHATALAIAQHAQETHQLRQD
jgi:hypothetical protein